MAIGHQIICTFGGGVIYRATGLNQPVRPKSKRGEISECSVKSRLRLKEFLLSMQVVDLPEWALTLTLHHPCTCDEFRMWFIRLRKRVVRSNIGLVWRIELQRRGVPHLHCVVWAEKLGDVEEICRDWIEITGMGSDDEAVLHSCMVRELTDGGWYGYLILHNTKAKRDQLGWRGRQWGVINRRLFSGRESQIWDLTYLQYRRIRRLLNRIYLMRGRRSELPHLAGWQAVGEDRFTVASVIRFVLEKQAKRGVK